MLNLSENYHLRKCFLQTDQVPTQSLIKKKMSPPLANVYFKSMNPKLRAMAGLEPPLKGGGTEWIMAPADILQGKHILKPMKKIHMTKWGWSGVDEVGMRLVEAHKERMLANKERLLLKHDLSWQTEINEATRKEWVKCIAVAEEANTDYINHAVHEFEILYTTSVTKLQDVFFDAAVKKIKDNREETFKFMQEKYETLLHQQATMLYDRYTKKLIRKKKRMKNNFINVLEKTHTTFRNRLHDVNVEKHVTIEKLRHFLECQALACRVYIAMKEKQECAKEMQLTKQKHIERKDTLTDDIRYINLKISLAETREQKQVEFETMWKKKVCRVVKQFQIFVSYCLNVLPDHAEFFINMEKLMLLQLSEVLEDPKVDSIIVMDVESFQTPKPRPHPFYLFCDKGFKPKLNQDLCPKHCTSSASQLPVIVINKQCIYSACDNFEQFTDKIKDYVEGRVKDDVNLKDHHDYSHDVPVKYTASTHLHEIQLENSLFQVLQQEIANARDLPIQCGQCKIPHCFYCSRSTSTESSHQSLHLAKEEIRQVPSPSVASEETMSVRGVGFKHRKEPKWESYLKHVKTKKCDCVKIAKKHLFENLPIYMRKMSPFDAPELLNYEMCSMSSLKLLVKAARGKETPPTPSVVPSTTRDMATQHSDHDFEYLCTCFSDDSMLDLLTGENKWSKLSNVSSADYEFRVVGASLPSTHLSKEAGLFATERARSLKRLINRSSDMREIFSRKDCDYDTRNFFC